MHVLGFPKSGNTWACYLLSYCLNSHFDDADVIEGLYPKEPELRKIVKGGLSHKSYKETLGPVLKTHFFEFPQKEVVNGIYLVRDPRDVMLSFYAFDTGYLQKQPIFGYGRWRESLHLMKVRMVYGIVKPPRFLYIKQKFPKWVRHAERARNMGLNRVLRYEDLKQNTAGALEQLFNSYNIQVDPAIIAKAIELFDFQKLKKLEAQKPEDQRFYRKGNSEGWKSALTEEEKEWIMRNGGHLLEEFGYL